MRKLWIPIVAVLVGLGLGATLLSLKPLSAHGDGNGGGMGMMGPAMMGGMGMMGPGMMGGMMGPGMMGRGQQGPGSSGYPNWQNMHEECEEMMEPHGYPANRQQQTGKTLTQENAVSIVQGYLNRTGNPNLEIGKVEKKEDGNYLVEIFTKDGSLVDKILVDRKTGRFTSIYWKDLN